MTACAHLAAIAAGATPYALQRRFEISGGSQARRTRCCIADMAVTRLVTAISACAHGMSQPQVYLHHPYLCRLDLTKSAQDAGEGCGLQHIQGMATCSRTIPHSPHCLIRLLILCVADVYLYRITLQLSPIPHGPESITRAQTHWLGPTRSAMCRSAFELAQRAQCDFLMIRFELAKRDQ